MKKILVNILSEQTIPNYVAIKEILPDFVIALATKEFMWQTEILEQISGIKHITKEVYAYNVQQNFKSLQSVFDEIEAGSEIIINYTGGTKIIAISVLLKFIAYSQNKLSFVYVNTSDNKLEYLFLDAEKQLSSASNSIECVVSLDKYISLRGEKIKTFENEISEKVDSRSELSKQLLLNKKLSGIFSRQKDFFEKIGKNYVPKQTYSFLNRNFSLSWNKTQIELNTAEQYFKFIHHDGGKYFAGGWLEELVFHKLKKSNFFDSVLANVKLDFTSENFAKKINENEQIKNEIDVVVSKGIKTVFVECKAGKVTQEHVYKLKSIRDYFLGTFGLAVLATKFKPNPNIIEKCKDAKIVVVSEDDLESIDLIVNNL